jgi:molybdopterin converting factor small subunit
MRVTVYLSGRLADPASNSTVLELPAGATVDDALAAVRGRPGVIPAALVAVAREHIGTVANHPPQPLNDGDEVFVFAPVAGG